MQDKSAPEINSSDDLIRYLGLEDVDGGTGAPKIESADDLIEYLGLEDQGGAPFRDGSGGSGLLSDDRSGLDRAGVAGGPDGAMGVPFTAPAEGGAEALTEAVEAGAELLPLIGGGLGAAGGFASPIPGGTLLGGAGGSALGEYARQSILGEDDPTGIAASAALGLIPGAGRAAVKAAPPLYRLGKEFLPDALGGAAGSVLGGTVIGTGDPLTDFAASGLLGGVVGGKGRGRYGKRIINAVRGKGDSKKRKRGNRRKKPEGSGK